MSPARWACIPLRELVEPGASIIYGILQPGRNIQDGVPYVRPTEIVNDRIHLPALRRTSQVISMRYARSMLQPDDVILSIVGTIGKVAIVPTGLAGGNITQSSARVRADRRLAVPAYVAAALRSPQVRRQFDNIRLGTAVQRLNLADVRQLEVPLAPLPEQQRIVGALESYFSRLDDAVATLERVQRNLRRYRASVLKAAVEGRLVPTEAELARSERRDYEPASVTLQRTEAPARPNRWNSRSRDVIPGHAALAVGNPRSELPEGWAWSSLVDIARMESGHTPSREHPEWWGGNVPWIGIADAREHDGRTINVTYQHTNSDGLANSAARLLPAGTVCISRTASVGYVVVTGCAMATSQDFVNWIPTGAVTSGWLRLIFGADREALRRFGKGSVHKTIYFPEWLAIHVAVPPVAEQARIVAEVDRLLSVVDDLDTILVTSRRRSGRLRQSILKLAFEGRLADQDPNDEPASVLLERIKMERAGATQTNKSRRSNGRARKIG